MVFGVSPKMLIKLKNVNFWRFLPFLGTNYTSKGRKVGAKLTCWRGGDGCVSSSGWAAGNMPLETVGGGSKNGEGVLKKDEKR